MPPLESRIVRKILKDLRARGGYFLKTYGSPVVTRGAPDIIGCYRGYYLAFEVKRDAAGKLSALQEFNLEEIRRAGGIARRIWSAEQALAVLDRIDEIKEAKSRRSSSGPP